MLLFFQVRQYYCMRARARAGERGRPGRGGHPAQPSCRPATAREIKPGCFHVSVRESGEFLYPIIRVGCLFDTIFYCHAHLLSFGKQKRESRRGGVSSWCSWVRGWETMNKALSSFFVRLFFSLHFFVENWHVQLGMFHCSSAKKRTRVFLERGASAAEEEEMVLSTSCLCFNFLPLSRVLLIRMGIRIRESSGTASGEKNRDSRRKTNGQKEEEG